MARDLRLRVNDTPAFEESAGASKVGLVYHSLRERIEQGDYSAGMRLPGEPALASEFEVPRHVVQSALGRLVQQDLVERRKGSGTYVLNRKILRPMRMFLEDVRSHGLEMARSTDMKLIDLRYEVPAAHIAEGLRLAPKERVQSTTRLRSLSGRTFSHVTTRIPERFARMMPEDAMQTEPVEDLYDCAGIAASWSTQSISATLSGPVIAGHLGMEVGSPLLTLTRATFNAAGKGILYLEGYYRPDMFNFQMDLVRRSNAGERRWDFHRKKEDPVSDEVA
jgi:GntR family transcriptional regulator